MTGVAGCKILDLGLILVVVTGCFLDCSKDRGICLERMKMKDRSVVG